MGDELSWALGEWGKPTSSGPLLSHVLPTRKLGASPASPVRLLSELMYPPFPFLSWCEEPCSGSYRAAVLLSALWQTCSVSLPKLPNPARVQFFSFFKWRNWTRWFLGSFLGVHLHLNCPVCTLYFSVGGTPKYKIISVCNVDIRNTFFSPKVICLVSLTSQQTLCRQRAYLLILWYLLVTSSRFSPWKVFNEFLLIDGREVRCWMRCWN